jgi:hypothetical protein
MHHCLEVNELVALICQFLHQDRKNRKSLVAFATTCKAFRDPALSILWSNLTTLVPLVKCLPIDVWEMKPVDPSQTEALEFFELVRILPLCLSQSSTLLFLKLQSLKRAPDNMDWTRYHFYASFVKSYQHDIFVAQSNGLDVFLGVDVVHALATSRPGIPILPRLTHLHWTISDSKIDPYISRFMGPHLLQMSLWFAATPEIMGNTLRSPRQGLLPNLQSITLLRDDRRDHPAQLIDFASDLISGLPQIREVNFDIKLHPDAIRHLAASHCTQLMIPNDVSEILQSIGWPVSSPTFPHLEELVVVVQDAKQALRFLSLLFVENLRELVISYSVSPPVWNVSPLTEFIGSQCSQARLRNFALRAPFSTDGPASHTLAPLLKFHNLTNILLAVSSDLEDTDVERMAASWPHLESVTLQKGSTGSSKLSLAAAVSFAVHCPALETLSLALRVEVVDFSALPAVGVLDPPRGLRRFDTQSSPISGLVELPELARFISTLFPTLKTVYGNPRMWAQVRHYLTVIHAQQI